MQGLELAAGAGAGSSQRPLPSPACTDVAGGRL